MVHTKNQICFNELLMIAVTPSSATVASEAKNILLRRGQGNSTTLPTPNDQIAGFHRHPGLSSTYWRNVWIAKWNKPHNCFFSPFQC